MLIKLHKKGQSTAEYAVLIGLIVATALAMQIYIRRGLQGRIAEGVDHTGTGGIVGGETLTFSGSQYEPYYLTSNASENRTANETENLLLGGGVSRATNATSNVSRNQIILPQHDY